jgi:hypothetical protein
MLKKLTVTCLGAAVLFVASAGPAFAGEVTGNGKRTGATEHANSICVFSGQNDDPTEATPFGGRTQNYGQLVRQGFKGVYPSPGVACRGGSNVPE